MEQEDMKALWKELSDRINNSELASKKTMAHIIHSKRKTARHRLMSADLTSSVFCSLLALGLAFVLFRENNGYTLLKIQAVSLSLLAGLINYVSFRLLSRLKWEAGVLAICKQVAVYKRLTVWGYFITYGGVIIFTVCFLSIYPQKNLLIGILSLLIPACIAIDCFLYRWSFSQLRTMTDATKELKELNQWEGNGNS